MWLFLLLYQWASNVVMMSLLSIVLSVVIISVYCVLWVRAQESAQ